MLAVSCKKDKEQKIDENGIGFRATVESHVGDSKTHLEGTAVKWSANESILVSSNTSTGKTFNFAGYASEGVAKFEASELPENFYEPNFTAYYPASSAITLNDEQTYVETGFAEGANPMMAVSGNTELQFKNLCGMLELQFYSESTFNVKSITITSSVDEKLNGEGTAEWNNGEPVLNLSSGTNSLTLNCENKPMSQVEASPTSYYFVLPAGTLASGFTVKVTDENDKVWEKTTEKNNSIVRSQITQLDKIEVNIPTPIPTPYYSVSATKKVLFAKGNLQYIGSAATPYWQFAAEQYEYFGKTTGQKSNNPAKDRDLFGWGATGIEYADHNTYYQIWDNATPSGDKPNTETDWKYFGYGYGPTSNGYKSNLSVTGQSDWGALTITNGEGKNWRTLSYSEWNYLFNNTEVRQPDGKLLRGFGCINGKNGLFILPDNWKEMIAFVGIADDFNYGSADFSGNVVSVDKWTKMQEAGATFLPAAGYRWEGDKKFVDKVIDGVGSCCSYWSSSYYDNSDKPGRAWAIDTQSGLLANHKRSKGFAVRLAYDLN